MFYSGEKFEWVKNHYCLQGYKLATQFSNLKDFKNFLGYDFISEKDFIEHIKSITATNIFISSYSLSHDEKVNIVNHLKNHQSMITFFR